jgi:putative transposase
MRVVDVFTRESLADLVAYSFDADAIVTTLGTVAASRGFPEFIRCDNGPELTATCGAGLC